MRVLVIVLYAMVVAIAAGCGTETAGEAMSSEETSSTTSSAPTSTTTAPASTTTASTTSTTTASSSSTTTASSSTTMSTTKSTTTSTSSSTTTSISTTTTTSTTPDETVGGYSEWEPFWSAFSTAAATGDKATVEALTADVLSFAYAGGGFSTWTGPTSEIMGTFNRPLETFEPGRRSLSDGTVFQAELRAAGPWSMLHEAGVPFDMGYRVFIEAGDNNPASATEYIFRKVDGRYLLVGYAVDS